MQIIKPELEQQYSEYIAKNEDVFSKAVVDASHEVMTELAKGKTPDEAIHRLNGKGLSGSMAGAAIEGAVYFSPRGEELRKEWNKQWGAPEDKEGLVDPSIITIDTKQA